MKARDRPAAQGSVSFIFFSFFFFGYESWRDSCFRVLPRLLVFRFFNQGLSGGRGIPEEGRKKGERRSQSPCRDDQSNSELSKDPAKHSRGWCYVLQQDTVRRSFVGRPARGRPVVTFRRNASLSPSSPPATVRFSSSHRLYRTRRALWVRSLSKGVVYLVLSWCGLIALMRSVINQQTIGPIVLFIGITLMDECLCFLPARHYPAMLFGMFPSIAGECQPRRRSLWAIHKIVVSQRCAERDNAVVWHLWDTQCV